MELTECFRQVERGDIVPVYLLHGEETLLMERLIRTLARAWLGDEHPDPWSLVRVDGDRGWDVLEPELEGGILGATRRLVVVENPPGCAPGKKNSDQDRQRWAELLGHLPPDLCLVLKVTGPVDKRREPARTVARLGRVWEMKRPEPGQLAQWIRNEGKKLGVAFERDALGQLVREWTGDLRGLIQVIEKLAAYNDFSGSITAAQVESLVDRGVSESVFQLLDCVTAGDTEGALSLLRRMLHRGEVPLMLLGLLGQKMRLLEAVRSLRNDGLGQRQAAEALGQHPYAVKKTWLAAGRVTEETTHWAMEACLAADRQIKKGQMPPEMALELLVADLCRLIKPHNTLQGGRTK